MNAPYLFIGLICGLAIGYAIGWQQRRKSKPVQVSRVVANCDGPIRCTNCTEKRRCAAVGCVRLAEQCDSPLGMTTPNPTPEQGGWLTGLDGVRRPNPAAGAPKPPFHNPVA